VVHPMIIRNLNQAVNDLVQIKVVKSAKKVSQSLEAKVNQVSQVAVEVVIKVQEVKRGAKGEIVEGEMVHEMWIKEIVKFM